MFLTDFIIQKYNSMLAQLPCFSIILSTLESATLEHTLETSPGETTGLVGLNKIRFQKTGHTRTHTHVESALPIVQRGDRWRGQAMSGEVKQKQAGDCFLGVLLLHCLETPLVRALHQGAQPISSGREHFSVVTQVVSLQKYHENENHGV